MKKLVCAVLLVCLVSVFPVSAYDTQPGDNTLLTKVYDRIDAVYETDHEKLIAFLDGILYLEIRHGHSPQSMYFLDKMKEYIHGKLYTFDQSPVYTCIDDRVQIGDTVTVAYTLTTDDGRTISLPKGALISSEPQKALVFNAGRGQVIKGFDHAVLGKEMGVDYGAVIDPKDARGSVNPSLLLELPTRAMYEAVPDMHVGNRVTMTATLSDGSSQKIVGYIIQIDAENTLIDFNHLLAGERILGHYTIEEMFKECR